MRPLPRVRPVGADLLRRGRRDTPMNSAASLPLFQKLHTYLSPLFLTFLFYGQVSHFVVKRDFRGKAVWVYALRSIIERRTHAYHY